MHHRVKSITDRLRDAAPTHIIDRLDAASQRAAETAEIFGRNFLDTLPLPKQTRATALLRAFGLFKIPVLLFVSPSVEELSDERCTIRIPLNWRTKNHLGAMYIGVLVAGADCAAGLAAMEEIRRSGRNVALLFKDLRAEFLRRAEGDVLFTCQDTAAVREAVHQVLATGERVNHPVQVVATVPEVDPEAAVARFTMTLSMKRE